MAEFDQLEVQAAYADCEQAESDVAFQQALASVHKILLNSYEEAKQRASQAVPPAERELYQKEQRVAGLKISYFVKLSDAKRRRAIDSYRGQSTLADEKESVRSAKKQRCEELINARLQVSQPGMVEQAKTQALLMLYESEFGEFPATNRQQGKLQQLRELDVQLNQTARCEVMAIWLTARVERISQQTLDEYKDVCLDRWQQAEMKLLTAYWQEVRRAFLRQRDEAPSGPFGSAPLEDPEVKRLARVLYRRLWILEKYLASKKPVRFLFAEWLADKDYLQKNYQDITAAPANSFGLNVEELGRESATERSLQEACAAIEEKRKQFLESSGGIFNLYPGQSLAVVAETDRQLQVSTRAACADWSSLGGKPVGRECLVRAADFLHSKQLVDAMLAAIERQIVYTGFSSEYFSALESLQALFPANLQLAGDCWAHLSQVTRVADPLVRADEGLEGMLGQFQQAVKQALPKLDEAGVLRLNRSQLGLLTSWFEACASDEGLAKKKFIARFCNELEFREGYLVQFEGYLQQQFQRLIDWRQAGRHSANMQQRSIDMLTEVNERLSSISYVDALSGCSHAPALAATQFNLSRQADVSLFSSLSGKLLGKSDIDELIVVNSMEALVLYCLENGDIEQVKRLASVFDINEMPEDDLLLEESLQLYFYPQGRFFYPAAFGRIVSPSEQFSQSMRKIGTKLLSLSLASQQVQSFAEQVDQLDIQSLLTSLGLKVCVAGEEAIVQARQSLRALIEVEISKLGRFSRAQKRALQQVGESLPDVRAIGVGRFRNVANRLVVKLFSGESPAIYQREGDEFKYQASAVAYLQLVDFIRSYADAEHQATFESKQPIRFFIEELKHAEGYGSYGLIKKGKLNNLLSFCSQFVTSKRLDALVLVAELIKQEGFWYELLDSLPVPAEFLVWYESGSLEGLRVGSRLHDNSFIRLADALATLCAGTEQAPAAYLRQLLSNYAQGFDYLRDDRWAQLLGALLQEEGVKLIDRDIRCLKNAADLFSAALRQGAQLVHSLDWIGVDGEVEALYQYEIVSRLKWLVRYDSGESCCLLADCAVSSERYLQQLEVGGDKVQATCFELLSIVSEVSALCAAQPSALARMAVARFCYLMRSSEQFGFSDKGRSFNCSAYGAIDDDAERQWSIDQDCKLLVAVKSDPYFTQAMQGELNRRLGMETLAACFARSQEIGEQLVSLIAHFGTKEQRLESMQISLARALNDLHEETENVDLFCQKITDYYLTNATDEVRGWCVNELCKQLREGIAIDLRADELQLGRYWLLLKLEVNQEECNELFIAFLERAWGRLSLDELVGFVNQFFLVRPHASKEFFKQWLLESYERLPDGSELDAIAKFANLAIGAEDDDRVADCMLAACQYYEALSIEQRADMDLETWLVSQIDARIGFSGVFSDQVRLAFQAQLAQKLEAMQQASQQLSLHPAFGLYYPVVVKRGNDSQRLALFKAKLVVFVNEDIGLGDGIAEVLALELADLVRYSSKRSWLYEQVMQHLVDIEQEVLPAKRSVFKSFTDQISYQRFERKVESLGVGRLAPGELFGIGNQATTYQQALRQQLICGELEAAVLQDDMESMQEKVAALPEEDLAPVAAQRLDGLISSPKPVTIATCFGPIVRSWSPAALLLSARYMGENKKSEIKRINSRELASFLCDHLVAPQLLASSRTIAPEFYQQAMGKIAAFVAHDDASSVDLLALLGDDEEQLRYLVRAVKNFLSNSQRVIPDQDRWMLHDFAEKVTDENFSTSAALRAQVRDAKQQLATEKSNLARVKATFWYKWSNFFGTAYAKGLKQQGSDSIREAFARQFVAQEKLRKAETLQAQFAALREMSVAKGFVTARRCLEELDRLIVACNEDAFDVGGIDLLAGNVGTMVGACNNQLLSSD